MRRYAICNTPLSRFNPGPHCQAHKPWMPGQGNGLDPRIMELAREILFSERNSDHPFIAAGMSEFVPSAE